MNQNHSDDRLPFSLKIVDIEEYSCRPIPLFDSPYHKNLVSTVPCIRLFGMTYAGQRVSAIVHGCLPYFFIDIPSNIMESINSELTLQSLCNKIMSNLNSLIQNEQSDSKPKQFIHSVVPVRAKDFYGFSLGEKIFLKIFVYAPYLISTLATLLRSGAVLSTQFQVYESHITHTLQFLLDYNVFSMNWIKFSNVKFRVPVPPAYKTREHISIGSDSPYDSFNLSDFPNFKKVWNKSNIPNAFISNIPKETTVEIEIDVLASDIMNYRSNFDQNMFSSQKIIQTLEYLWDEERLRRKYFNNDVTFEDLNSYYETREDEQRLEIVNPINDELLDKLIQFEKEYINEHGGERLSFDESQIEDKLKSFKQNSYSSSSQNMSFLQINDGFDMYEHKELNEMMSRLPLSNIPFSHIYNEKSIICEVEIDEDKIMDQDFENILMALDIDDEEKEIKDKTGHINDEKEIEEIMESQLMFEQMASQYFENTQYNHNIENDTESKNEYPTPLSVSFASSSQSSLHEEAKTKKLDISGLSKFTTKTSFSNRKRNRQQIEKDRNPVKRILEFNKKPPTLEEIYNAMTGTDFPVIQHTQPFFTENETFKKKNTIQSSINPLIQPSYIHELPPFKDESENKDKLRKYGEIMMKKTNVKSRFTGNNLRVLTPARDPPSLYHVTNFQDEKKKKKKIYSDYSQIDGPSPKNPYGFLINPSQISYESSSHEGLILLSCEVFAKSVNDLLPDPKTNEVYCIYCSLRDEIQKMKHPDTYKDCIYLFMLTDQSSNVKDMNGFVIYSYKNELDLLKGFSNFVREKDPDILVGYEVQQSSFGYIVDRADHLGIEDYLDLLGRSLKKRKRNKESEKYKWEYKKQSGLLITGRIVLNLWRVIKRHIETPIYSFENAVYNILHQRVPHFENQSLTNWYFSKFQWKTHSYFIQRSQYNIKLIDALDIISSTSELSRLYGITFFSVISRGSQYKVESIMLRITKAMNYICLSCTPQMVANQMAPACVPLVIEPISRFYNDPVLVFDFRSLYPSMILAYNFCFSTCLGRISPGEGPENVKRLGARKYSLPRGYLDILKKYIYISSNGVMFIRKEVHTGVLPRMVNEILETRYMLKQSMKQINDNVVKNKYNFRQEGLKLIANVIYGYAGASFSGRMPCIDVADSIVQTGRETLERAIRTIESNKSWGGKVIYGDTDSIFVLLKGTTKERAFKIGNEISEAITNQNPWPVKLNFEKCYSQSVLLTKKRYCGYKYTSVDQTEPQFEGKGTETMRSDSCPAVAKIMEKSLKILFETKDITLIKKYLLKQFNKIISNKISLTDFIFRKQVRLGSYRGKILPPAALVAKKEMERDPRREPRNKEMIPYFVSIGTPNSRLIDLVFHPREYLENPQRFSINAHYYISKQIIPALSRVFELMNVNIYEWYQSISKRILSPLFLYQLNAITDKKDKIYHYFSCQQCIICGTLTNGDHKFCDDCLSKRQSTSFILYSKLRLSQDDYHKMRQICLQCESLLSSIDIECTEYECPILYERKKLEYKSKTMESLVNNFEED